MTTSVFGATTADGNMTGSNATWATVRAAETASIGAVTTDAYGAGQSFLLSAVYYIQRTLIPFNTAAIPDSDIIDSMTLDCSVETVQGAGEVIHLVTCPTTVTAGNFALANWGADSAGAFPASMTLNNRYSAAIDLTKITANKTGTTYIGLRGVGDLNNAAPAGFNRYRFHSADATTSAYRPTLTVVHHASGIPRQYRHYQRLRSA